MDAVGDQKIDKKDSGICSKYAELNLNKSKMLNFNTLASVVNLNLQQYINPACYFIGTGQQAGFFIQ